MFCCGRGRYLQNILAVLLPTSNYTALALDSICTRVAEMGSVLGSSMKSVMEENMKKQFKFQEDMMIEQVCIWRRLDGMLSLTFYQLSCVMILLQFSE